MFFKMAAVYLLCKLIELPFYEMWPIALKKMEYCTLCKCFNITFDGYKFTIAVKGMEYIIFDANNIKFTCGVNGP